MFERAEDVVIEILRARTQRERSDGLRLQFDGESGGGSGGGFLKRLASFQAGFDGGAKRATELDETLALFVLDVIAGHFGADFTEGRFARRKNFFPEQHNTAG